MNHFRIGLSTPINSNILADFIKYQQGIDFSHVYLSFYDTEVNRWVIYHATLRGVHFLSEEDFKRNNTIIKEYNFNITETQKIDLKNWAIDNLDKKYSIKQLLYIYIYEDLNVKLDFLKSDDYWICCEAAARALTQLNIIKDVEYDLVDLKYTKNILDNNSLTYNSEV